MPLFSENYFRARYAQEMGKTFQNPFDLGMDKNFQHFFGTFLGDHWYSYLLPGGAKPIGDGIKWVTRYDSLV